MGLEEPAQRLFARPHDAAEVEGEVIFAMRVDHVVDELLPLSLCFWLRCRHRMLLPFP